MKKKETQNNYVYVVLVKAHTGLGKLSRLTSKYEYTHIAICPNENFQSFYAFSRRKHYAPFDCGFTVETLDCYAYGEYEEVKLKIFKLPVSKENHKQIKDYIQKISRDTEYIFNFYSIPIGIFRGIKIYKAHNCTSFAGKIIKLSQTVKMQKPYYKYDIKEMDALLTEYLFKEETFKKTEVKTKDYMQKIGFFKNVLYFIRLNGTLIYRLISKGKNYDE